MTTGLAQGTPGGLEGETSTGVSPRAAALLAYSGWWVSGAVWLLLEPVHPFVRFHAKQAFVGLGLLWLAGLALWMLSLAAVFVSTPLFRVSAVLAQLLWAAAVAAWVACLVQTWRGRWWTLPGMRWILRTSRPDAPRGR